MSEIHIKRTALFQTKGRDMFSSSIIIDSFAQADIDNINEMICRKLTEKEVMKNEIARTERTSTTQTDAVETAED